MESLFSSVWEFEGLSGGMTAATTRPIAQIEKMNSTQYVDGGVWANNPSLVGFTEAAWHFVGPGKQYDHLSLLSIASLNFGSGKPALLKRRRSFIQWAPDIFDLSLIAQSEFANNFLNMIQKNKIFPMTYMRIPSAVVAAEQVRFIKLDLATPRSFTLINQYARDTYHRYRINTAVNEFFSEKKTYKTHPGP